MKIIGIAGGAGSGKTTLARALKAKFEDEGKTADIISLDAFYFADGINGRYLIGKTNGKRFLDANHPDSINQQAVQKEIDKITTDSLIIEGLFTLILPNIFSQLDLSIYLDTPADIRLGRKIIRKFNEKQTPPNIVFRNYLESVRDRHYEFIEPSQTKATHIINGTQETSKQISQINL